MKTLQDIVQTSECAAYQSKAIQAGFAVGSGDCNTVRRTGLLYFPQGIPLTCCPGIRGLVTQVITYIIKHVCQSYLA
jgi:hypothetical protein